MSSLTWLDFSEHERRQAERIIALFEDKGTVDQLGVGTIRDALADLLFPGMSVIQSRARYFLLVPWMYLDLERRRVPALRFGSEASTFERRLIITLIDSGDGTGVIGRVARERLKLLPSTIYWQGLARLGIRIFPGSQRQYHRSMDRFYQSIGRVVWTDDGDVASGGVLRNWHAGLPSAPDDFPDGASLVLTRPEAEYLRERIRLKVPGTMLAFLVDRGKLTEPVPLPWMHPQVGELPEGVRRVLDHARVFSEVMHGAALLYNLMLARAQKNERYVGDYQEALADWAGLMDGRAPALEAWSETDFWALLAGTAANITEAARAFVKRWFGLARGGRARLADSPEAQRLIRERERLLKRGLARLENQRALDLWGGASGADQMNYRWSPVVQDTVRDIHLGLGLDGA